MLQHGIDLDDTKLQKLTMEISYILIDDTKVGAQENEDRRIRASILKNILKINDADLGLNENYVANVGQDKINYIKTAVSQYYQYTQFKRARFICTDMIHDTETGRVIGMNFKVQTKVDKSGQTVIQFD